jgi:hypothetical protein
MGKLKNSELLQKMIFSLFNTAGRRTSQGFAVTIVSAISKTLVQKYDFLVYIEIDPQGEKVEDIIKISKEIDAVHPVKVAKAIEALVRVIFMDLRSKAGLYFINELKKNAGFEVISELKNLGVDLDLLQIEQHYIYRRFARSINPTKDQSESQTMLGYSWKEVSTWKYDEKSKTCLLFDSQGKEIDKLNVEKIIKNHVDFLSEDEVNVPTIQSIGADLNEKELDFLKMVQERDLDFATAQHLLHISEPDLNLIINKLLRLELLQYVSHNEVAITEVGQNFLKEKESYTKDLIRI